MFRSPDAPAPTPSPTARAAAAPPPLRVNGLIAFRTNRDGHNQIYVMNADGTEQRNLSNGPNPEGAPAWSPDGRTIVFSRWIESSEADAVATMNADGSGVRLLTDPALGFSYFPSWSPDGSLITFTSERDGNAEVYVMNADGSNQRRLTDHPSEDHPGGFSPDGSQIAFASGRDGDGSHIFVMSIDGSDVRRVTDGPPGSDGPHWSHDGELIVYSTYDGRIAVMSPDGRGVRNLTEGPTDYAPRWSPDGRRIVFFRGDGAAAEIYVVDANGANLIQLTDNTAEDVWPDWQSRPPP